MNSIDKSNIDKTFGNLFKVYREKLNLTQEDLSESIGISPKYISRIETGNGGIKSKTLINYINTLAISPNMLYKDFITNPKLKNEIEICEKLNELSEQNVQLIISIIDLLKKLNSNK